MKRTLPPSLALLMALGLTGCQAPDEAAPAAHPSSATGPDRDDTSGPSTTAPTRPQSDAAAEHDIARPRLDSFQQPTGAPAPSWPVAVPDAPAPADAGGWPRGGVVHPSDVDRSDAEAVAAAYLQLLMSSDASTDTGRADAWRRASALATPEQALTLTADLPGGSSHDEEWNMLQRTEGYALATATIDFTHIIPESDDQQLLARAHVLVTRHDEGEATAGPELPFDVVLTLTDGQRWAVESTQGAAEVNHDDHSH